MVLAEGAAGDKAALRALAHPVRLEIISLLTGASMTAAEVARELGITHPNASYHLRNLLSGGLITVAGEEKIRGGIAKRYRYGAAHPATPGPHRAAAAERGLRAAAGLRPEVGLPGDAEIWIDPRTWQEIRDRIAGAVRDLHAAARPPHTPGTVRAGLTVTLVEPP